MTITQADFVALLPFSNKIEAQQLDAFISQARQFDLLPLLGHETLEALDALTAPALLSPPASGVAAASGSYYVRRNRVYRALSATTDPVPVLRATGAITSPGTAANPPAEGAWQYERVLTLWSQYVRPYWVQRAFARFIVTHGLNIAKAGITVPIDKALGTYERPSAGQVATLQASIDNTAETLLSALTRFLRYEGLLWSIDPATGAGGYSLDGCTHYGSEASGPHAHSTQRRHRRPIRGINR
jgi:hypothetical protein